MPSSPVSFLITTVSLCLLLIALAASFSVVSNTILRDSTRTQLTEVADRVAGVITELRVLLHMSNEESCTLVKTLNLPKEVLLMGYTVSIEETDDMYFVVASLDMDRSVSGRSALWSKYDEVGVTLDNGTFATEEFSVNYVCEIHSGEANPLAWVRRTQSEVSVGLGVVGG